MSPYVYLVIPVGIGLGLYLLRKIRELQWGWVRNRYPLTGRLFIITGSNTGLGYETAKALVSREATVIMACRDMEKANNAIENIRKITKNGELIPLQLDLASFDSTRKFAAEIKAKYPTFDCLINNAGLGIETPQYTQEGYELHCGVNHLGHFLLFDLLKDNIKNSNARVVVVSSKLHEIRTKIDLENFGKWVERPRGERFNLLYGNSKLMNFYFTRELYKNGYDAHVLCPGLCNTDFFRYYFQRKWYQYVLLAPIALVLVRSAEQGAQNIIHCATDNVNTDAKNPCTGYYVSSLKMTKSKVQFDEAVSEQLWKESERQVALHSPK
ncbi:retinol dehydrogenase 12-like [Uranotaenia lowii]|uniref:retinol dehydrogenase 12-like n=1 Tax=Uranotaenia lowii TaxID=190385 RepID=UPI0024783361|nr:retinol dehydrogenase 12-like [Uranotaenia lowii]